ncbi:hypothetical protein UPYG_G00155600 [Umbra pygmaea]|uniref:Uncharacterized protein n=1 Tax=Umbra pygmaea TaxID=75934 RepID=A0ABD0XE68_UMBPY
MNCIFLKLWLLCMAACEFWVPGCSSVVGCGQPEPVLNGKVTFISGTQNQHGSIIQYHCNEPFYSLPNGAKANFTCSLDGKWKDDQRNSLIPQCVPACGRPTFTLPEFRRIIGGKEAPPNSFPWHVFLRTNQGRGGGMVIGDYWILTAAHVLYGNTMKTVKVYVGVNNLHDLSKPLEVSSIHLHPKYNDSEKNYDHDIGLIHLKHSVTYNTNVMPLCLPTKDSKYPTGQNGLVSGFGTMENDTSTNALQYVPVPVVDQEHCRRSVDMVKVEMKEMASKEIIPSLTENMFCAGNPEGGKDACQGDSGGPFVLKEKEQFWAAGIVSWGISCGQPNRYGVYTRVANYVDWINKTIEEEEQRTIVDCGEPEALLNGGVSTVSGSQNQYTSTIQYHCNEPFYSLFGGTGSYTCTKDREWRDSLGNLGIPSCIPVCGKPTVSISGFQRILGGDKAPKNTIPWQVLLNVDGGRGGAMVIGDHWIMTAASSLFNDGNLVKKEKVRVFVGDNDAEKLVNAPPLSIASIHPHPEYNSTERPNYNNDIALIKLQQPITFHAAIMPLCLPPEGANYTSGLIGMVSGFGVKEDYIIPNNLRYIRLPVVDQSRCKTSIDNVRKTQRGTIPVLTDNMFCVGVPEGGKDSCQGDSGGPYVLKDVSDGSFWAAGIVSWGVGCGERGQYGVYTRVANYIDWIKKTMESHK